MSCIACACVPSDVWFLWCELRKRLCWSRKPHRPRNRRRSCQTAEPPSKTRWMLLSSYESCHPSEACMPIATKQHGIHKVNTNRWPRSNDWRCSFVISNVGWKITFLSSIDESYTFAPMLLRKSSFSIRSGWKKNLVSLVQFYQFLRCLSNNSRHQKPRWKLNASLHPHYWQIMSTSQWIMPTPEKRPVSISKHSDS